MNLERRVWPLPRRSQGLVDPAALARHDPGDLLLEYLERQLLPGMDPETEDANLAAGHV